VRTRIPASERTSQKLDELLTQGIADGDARAELLKLAVRKIVEEALEAEVAEAVGRSYYENGAPPGAGYRNGYRRGRLATAEGPIEYGVPQVADRAEPFVSRVRARLAGRTAELERLAVEMFARGLSTRDIEAAFRDASGASVLSRTAVSQVTERLWQEYEAFAGRDLSEFSVAYLFVDGVAERLHAGLPREAVLCAWGITDDGQNGPAAPGAGHERGHGELHGLLRGSQAPRVGRSAARRHRRGAGADPRGGNVLPAGAAPTLPRASAPQSPEQSPREPVAGDRAAGPRLLRGGVARAGHGPAR
jgi:Transposase, Mutator family